jgi:hypothetical protein
MPVNLQNLTRKHIRQQANIRRILQKKTQPLILSEVAPTYLISRPFLRQLTALSPAMRAMRAEHIRHTVREFGEYRSYQGAIWNQIPEKAHRRAHRRGANSNSMAYADIYKQDTTALMVKRFTKKGKHA